VFVWRTHASRIFRMLSLTGDCIQRFTTMTRGIAPVLCFVFTKGDTREQFKTGIQVVRATTTFKKVILAQRAHPRYMGEPATWSTIAEACS
jgi:hypothetical protein